MSDSADNSDTASVSATAVTVIPPGTLIPRPDGRGALKYGNPGNKGGIGRPPKEVKSRSRQLYERVLGRLEKQLQADEDGAKPLRSEQLVNIGQMAAKYAELGGDDDGDRDITLRVVRVDPQPYDVAPE